MNHRFPAAASDLLQPLLARPAVRCRVVGASRTAVHVATGDAAVPVLSVVAPGGARLPGACVLAPRSPSPSVDHGDLAAAGVLEPLGAADHLLVGDGTVGLGDLTVVVSRWWGQPVVRMPDRPDELRAGAAVLAAVLESGRPTPSGPVAGAADRLTDAAGAGDPVAIRRAVHAMVGLGPGLSPAADDILVGALICWHHLGRGGWTDTGISRVVSSAVRERFDRTTSVSVALLHHAAHGACVPEALGLLDALRTPAAIAGAVADLARVGHETGVSIALGISIATGAVLAARAPERLAR